MEQLVGHMIGRDDGDVAVLALLDRVWRMHPEVGAGEIMGCALAAQVRHLAELPLAGGWMMRFLRDLPACAPVDGLRWSTEVDEDVVYALELRRIFHGDHAEPVYQDASHIRRIALRHLPTGSVCAIALHSYHQGSRRDMRPRRTS